MADNVNAAPIYAAGQEPERALARLKVNTTLSLKRRPIGFHRAALRFHQARARSRQTGSVLPGHAPGVSRRGARPMPANLPCFGTAMVGGDPIQLGAKARTVSAG